MNPYEITFPINTTTGIIAQLIDPLDHVCYNYAEPLVLLKDNQKIILTNGPTYFNVRDLRDMLKKALANQLQLHNSIASDIGYLCNGCDYNELGFPTEFSESGMQLWVGYKYFLWLSHENEKRYKTWIYNDKKGDIILEVTPQYPYHFCDIKKQCHYIPFKKWILQYKPHLKITLSKEVAKEWLNIAEHFIKTVEDNDKHWEEEYKLSQNK